MTQFKHDEFAKDLFSAILESYGKVQIDRPVTNELRRIDVYFTPTEIVPNDPTLNLLWKCATCGAAFEAFRSAVKDDEIRSTMGKLFDVHGEIIREAKRIKATPIKTDALPQLWIITPTMSKDKLKAANVVSKEEEWCKGIYWIGDIFRTGIIVVHHLPKIPETVWFRTLGLGKVQQEAINEIAALPKDSSYRQKILELFATLKVNLENNVNKKPDDLELLMTLSKSPLFVEYMERTRAENFTSVVEGLLTNRFGALDEELSSIVPKIIKLQPIEFTSLLITLNRQELLDRFTNN
jgi:hypothetical protein